MKKTSKEWWLEVRDNPGKLARWLKAQYYGERKAAERIFQFAMSQPSGERKDTLMLIAGQEAQHAMWVRGLLRKRGIVPLNQKKTRYWAKTLTRDMNKMTLQELAAVGAHAEQMRLNRIKVIANDKKAPADIRRVFESILPDEIFHTIAFRSMAGARAYNAARKNHEKGLNALGLVV